MTMLASGPELVGVPIAPSELNSHITITWYALHGNPDSDLQARRRAAPWYRQKATVSYADMLASLRRELIRHEYFAQAPAATTKPQITPASG